MHTSGFTQSLSRRTHFKKTKQNQKIADSTLASPIFVKKGSHTEWLRKDLGLRSWKTVSVFAENCECLCLRHSRIFFWSKLYFSLDSVKYFTASWELLTKAEIGKCHIFCSCTLSILFRDWRHCLGLYHFNFNNRLEPSLSAYVSWINTEWCEVFSFLSQNPYPEITQCAVIGK